jgi:hypothetical protein
MGETQQGLQESTRVGMYTETLARLYLRQGFTREALQIYRRLAQEQPTERRWQDQIRALTQQVTALPVVEDESAQTLSVTRKGGTVADEAYRTWRVIAELELWLHRLRRR